VTDSWQKNSEKRFSVLVPVYNREKLVGQTIDSVLAQTFTDYELFVVDDQSTDNTRDVLRSYGARINVIHQEHQGPEVGRSRAAAMAKGEYFVLLDSDDLLMPYALAMYDRIIHALGSPPLIISAMKTFSHGQTIQPESYGEEMVEVLKYRDYLSIGRSIAMSSSQIVVRRSDFETAGGLRKEATAFPFDTLDIVLRLGTYQPCVVIKRPITVAYRIHDFNTIVNLEYMIKSFPTVIYLERRGAYPGGWARIFGRYACIGSMASHFVERALKEGRPGLGLKLLLSSSPMITAKVINKLLGMFRKAMVTIRLHKEDDFTQGVI